MALGLNKILIASSNTNTPGGYYQLTTINATTAGNVVPAGSYIVFPTTNVVIQAVSAYNTTTNTATWTNVAAVSIGAPFLASDGTNVRVLATTNATVTLATVNGGEAAPGTFNT